MSDLSFWDVQSLVAELEAKSEPMDHRVPGRPIRIKATGYEFYIMFVQPEMAEAWGLRDCDLTPRERWKKQDRERRWKRLEESGGVE